MSITFLPWPKTPRLHRRMVITEKIDGCNCAIIVAEEGTVGAQSRNRLLTPNSGDHCGFAAWVSRNAEQLREILGPGHHYGEWWGAGIQRGYGLRERRFSLFNTYRWGAAAEALARVPGLGVVPVLYEGPFDTGKATEVAELLREFGSVAAPDYVNPEGIVVYHEAARAMFKLVLDRDDVPKALAA
ncbi:RNA ligase family protein [Crossiella sp. CA198]|uniref:RNA ligase family protein n=1 Tax=Crossiella sp. CA198 TaxID=3455607 RepID=UPI003F8D3667